LYLDPPWGGPDYINKQYVDLHLTTAAVGGGSSKINLIDVIKGIRDAKYRPGSTTYTFLKLIALKVPFNYNFDSLTPLNLKFNKVDVTAGYANKIIFTLLFIQL